MYYAVMVTHSVLWFAVGSGLVASMFFAFAVCGRTHRLSL